MSSEEHGYNYKLATPCYCIACAKYKSWGKSFQTPQLQSYPLDIRT